MNGVDRTGNNLLGSILTLLEGDLNKIMRREVHNPDRINLYAVGEYWVAFEKSAYLLGCLPVQSEKPLVLYLRSHPFPIVLRAIRYSRLRSVCRNHVIAKRTFDYLQLLTVRADAVSYNKWHSEYVPVHHD